MLECSSMISDLATQALQLGRLFQDLKGNVDEGRMDVGILQKTVSAYSAIFTDWPKRFKPKLTALGVVDNWIDMLRNIVEQRREPVMHLLIVATASRVKASVEEMESRMQALDDIAAGGDAQGVLWYSTYKKGAQVLDWARQAVTSVKDNAIESKLGHMVQAVRGIACPLVLQCRFPGSEGSIFTQPLLVSACMFLASSIASRCDAMPESSHGVQIASIRDGRASCAKASRGSGSGQSICLCVCT